MLLAELDVELHSKGTCIAGVSGSNPAGGMDVRWLCVVQVAASVTG
jgi:hypothetical protein